MTVEPDLRNPAGSRVRSFGHGVPVSVDEAACAVLQLGIGFVPFSPLGRGFLTGTVDATTEFSDGDIRANLPRFTLKAREAKPRTGRPSPDGGRARARPSAKAHSRGSWPRNRPPSRSLTPAA